MKKPLALLLSLLMLFSLTACGGQEDAPPPTAISPPQRPATTRIQAASRPLFPS